MITSFYFAFERTRFALGVSLGNILLNLVANWMMVDHFGHVGLAWGYSLTQGLSLIPMVWGMGRHHIQLEKKAFFRSMSFLIVGSLLAGVILQLMRNFVFIPLIDGLFDTESPPQWMSGGILLLLSGATIVIIYIPLVLGALQKSPSEIGTAIRLKKHPKV